MLVPVGSGGRGSPGSAGGAVGNVGCVGGGGGGGRPGVGRRLPVAPVNKAPSSRAHRQQRRGAGEQPGPRDDPFRGARRAAPAPRAGPPRRSAVYEPNVASSLTSSRERRLVLVVTRPGFRRPRAALVLADQAERARGQVGMPGSGAGRGADERGQLGQDGRGGRPVPGAALQAGGDDGGQLRGQAGQVGGLGGQPDQDVHHRVAQVGRMPGRREQQGRPEREHVAGHGRLPGVPGLLRGHVRGRAQRTPGHGELDPLGRPGHPEIDHAGAVGGDEHVRGLQVPVHQPGLWIDSSASAHPAASQRTAGTGSGPPPRTSRFRDGAAI